MVYIAPAATSEMQIDGSAAEKVPVPFLFKFVVMKWMIIILNLFILLTNKSSGQSLTSNESLVESLMAGKHVTGLQLSIINRNEIIYTKGYGYRNKAKGEMNDTATCFYAASLAKSVFAYIVMQLVDEGKIDLDKPLYGYLPKPLPDYENYKDLQGDDRWMLITARNCLDHTTGFPNWRQLNPHGNSKLEIFFKPGERYAYSGEGIYLLQFVTETITGQTLEELAQEKIFLPFGMYRTSFLWQPSFETDYAVGHNAKEDTLHKRRSKKMNAAGSMETTVADYSRFMAAVMQGKNLSRKSWNEMLTPQIRIYSEEQFPSLNNDITAKNDIIELSYGLGWGLMKTPDGKAFFKEGHDEGWTHYTIGIPEKGNALIIMTNSSNGEKIFTELVEKIMGVTIPWKWEGYKK
jgi:CubicO group peptidase (beta-lactamase class C family)